MPPSSAPQVFIVQTVLQQLPAGGRVPALPPQTQNMLLIYIRMVTWNQILDPWVYILCRRAVLQRVYPSLRPRPSIASLSPRSPSLRRKLAAGSGDARGGQGRATSASRSPPTLINRPHHPPRWGPGPLPALSPAE